MWYTILQLEEGEADIDWLEYDSQHGDPAWDLYQKDGGGAKTLGPFDEMGQKCQ